jgi:hypothetical protein
VILAVLLSTFLPAAAATAEWEQRLGLTCEEYFSLWGAIEPPSNAQQLLASTMLENESHRSIRWYRGRGLAACLRKPPIAPFFCNRVLVVRVTREKGERVTYEEPWVLCPPAPPKT